MDIPPATTPNPATIVYDEREELFREAAALGNSKAVLHYVQAGVNANARNKINGWTPLHWAASRGHLPIVHLLVRHGADPAILNFKKQTALDLAKSSEVRDFLEQRTPAVAAATAAAAPSSSTADSDGAPAKSEEKVEAVQDTLSQLSIKPNYLREPDLLKTWSSPEELPSQLKPTVLTEADRPVAAAAPTPSRTVPAASTMCETTATSLPSQRPAAAAPFSRPSPTTGTHVPCHSPNLIRIAISAVSKGTAVPALHGLAVPATLVGHVLCDPTAGLSDLVRQIEDELLQDDNVGALTHLYQDNKLVLGEERRRVVSRLMVRISSAHVGCDGPWALVPIPRSQWAKHSVGQMVVTEVKESGSPWALVVAEIEVS